MSTVVDIHSLISSVIEAEVSAALEPYRCVLERLNAFISSTPALTSRRAAKPVEIPVRHISSAAPASRVATAKPRKAKQRTAPSPFKPGQTVEYKQGRGTFEAKVISVSEEAEVITLERAKDGKRIVRPESKVSAGTSPVPQPELPAVAPVKPIIRRNGQNNEPAAPPSAANAAPSATPTPPESPSQEQTMAELLSVMKAKIAVP